MVQEQQNVSHRIEIRSEQADIARVMVSIPAFIADKVFHEAALTQQRSVKTHGFTKSKVPLEYIKTIYQPVLTEHVIEFLINYCVLSLLHQELRSKKLVAAGHPRLIDVQVELGSDALFLFEVNIINTIFIHEWKHLPFKAPQRKNYKDLDRQVEGFLKEELKQQETYQDKGIQVGDWVHFEAHLVDGNKTPLLGTHVERLWLKIGDEEGDAALQELFVGKQAGESFITADATIQNYFSSHLATDYPFHIKIDDIVPCAYFSVEHFKNHFRIKTNKMLHQKLIEVFSYRNDLSQRRSIGEESLHLLLSKYRFVIPNHLILRQQDRILETIKSNPDYHVYRAEKSFTHNVRKLAEKQVRETLLLDSLAYKENLQVHHHDLKNYLNLTLRPRMKEFLYFDPPATKINEQEMPLATEILKNICLREKTLNHIIYHLTAA